MSQIKPFKALYYNIAKVKDFGRVVSPPYDVISDEQLIQFHNLSPYNFTHIDLARDKPNEDRYSRSKKIFDEWLSKGVLVQDEKPSLYFYKQDYKIMGQRHARLGFVALMKLENEEDSKVHPHENTHAHAVDDRYQLTKALGSNLSSIFVCYSDSQKRVEKAFNKKIVQTDPLVDVTDKDQVHHRLWRVSDEEIIKDIDGSLDGQNLFIADGHHRFQVACNYREARLGRKVNPSNGEEPFNYVMTYFTNLDSKDLQIFPMHRIIKNLPKKLDFLEEYFRIDNLRNKEEILIPLAKAGINEHAFGLYAKDGVKLLRLKNKSLINNYVKEGSQEYKQLDATILKCFIFDQVGIKSDNIIYTKDFDEATNMVDNGQAAASFIMNPVKISQLKAIALNGERMPPKTTYFYPKVLSGLTVYKMD